MNSIYDDLEEPVPPKFHAKLAGHHWLEIFDCDGHSFGIVVLQWNPGAQKWSHSGGVATGSYVNTKGWKYIAECPLPNETTSSGDKK